MKRSLLLIAIAFFSIFSLQNTAGAATITVTDLADRFDNTPGITGCSLREAIRSVNDGAAYNDGCAAEFSGNFSVDPNVPDVINLIAGDYILDINGPNEDDDATGDLDIHRPVDIIGAGPLATTISASGFDANNKDRVLDITSAGGAGFFSSLIPVTLSGTTIRDGDVRDIPHVGGGIRSFGAFLTLSDDIVTENFAAQGGGIFSANNILVVLNSQILNNQTEPLVGPANGGGIFSEEAFLLVDSSTVAGNAITNGNGAGIFSGGIAVVTNSTISGNQISLAAAGAGPGVAGFGGGIADFYERELLVINSTISGNTAILGGGGIALLADTIGIINNIQPGIFNVTIAKNTVTANNGVGGGICANCLTGLTALVDGTGGPTLYPVVNTLIAENQAPNGIGPDCFGVFSSLGFNLIGDIESTTQVCLGFIDGVNGNKVGGDTNPVIDPMITDLQDNGGPTFTHGLILGSKAIDMGDDDGCRAPTIPSDPIDLFANGTDPAAELLRDQRNFPRPIDGDLDGTPICDIGAFEFQVFGFEMTKVDSTGGNEVPIGDTFDYVITVTNNGPGTASNVTINDPVPANVSVVSANSSQGTCAAIGNVVGCNLGDLASGASATVTVTVLAEVEGTFTNIATLNLTNPSQQTLTMTAQVTTTIAQNTFVEGSGIHCEMQHGTPATGSIPGLALILLAGTAGLVFWRRRAH